MRHLTYLRFGLQNELYSISSHFWVLQSSGYDTKVILLRRFLKASTVTTFYYLGYLSARNCFKTNRK